MNCNDIKSLFSEYYDGENTVPLGDIKAHLSECAACRTEYNAYAQLITDVRNLPQPKVPPGFFEAMVDYVQNHEPGAAVAMPRQIRRKSHVVSQFISLAAVAAAIVLMFMWVNPPTFLQVDPYEAGELNGYIAPMPIDARIGIEPIGLTLEEPIDEPQSEHNPVLLISAIGLFVVAGVGGVIVIRSRLQ